MNWRNLFAAKNDKSLQFFPPTIADGSVSIGPSIEVFDEGIMVWQGSLVAEFIGAPPSLPVLQILAKQIWRKFGDIDVNTAGENLFLLQFVSDDDRDWVLDNGPWHIQNKPVIPRKWSPNLKSLDFAMDQLSIWVHLYGVPLELFMDLGLSYISSFFR
ncbi:hypothetical protein V6N13_142582 [Hibiscus sabdariffa]